LQVLIHHDGRPSKHRGEDREQLKYRCDGSEDSRGRQRSVSRDYIRRSDTRESSASSRSTRSRDCIQHRKYIIRVLILNLKRNV
jgi:hypothetical protein